MQIWKWPLPVVQTQHLSLPIGAQILCVKLQNGEPQLWALVDEVAPRKFRAIHTYGTGHDIPVGRERDRYVGTYLLNEDRFVFHVFEGSELTITAA